MASIVGLIQRNLKCNSPPVAPKNASPIRIGIIGAARIGPSALILPARSHPDVVISAVAARDKAKAAEYAKLHGIEKVFSGSNGYQEMLDDPSIDAVYNPLPNGLHFEWTMRALAAGKHVLLEKPSSDSAEETRRMFEFAREKNLVLLEAFHYRFHPAAQRVKEIIDSGEPGNVKSISASLAVGGNIVPHDDIRFNFELGGGAMMDVGVYTLNVIRYLLSAEPTSIESATPILHFKNPEAVDRGMNAVMAFPNSVLADITCDLKLPSWLGVIPPIPKFSVIVRLEGGEISFTNFVMPTLWHSIRVAPKQGKARTEKAYTFPSGSLKGEDWWSTYRYQLEAFVERVRGREPQTWVSGEDSVAQMEAVGKIYVKAGLPPRPLSSYTPN